MSRVFSANEICERALRKIGAYAIRSSGARAEEMEETRYWLDMVIGHLSARKRTWWLVPTTGSFKLLPNISNYDLNQALGPQQAPNGIGAVISVQIVTNGVASGGPDSYPNALGWPGNGDEAGDIISVGPNGLPNIPIVRRQEFEAMVDATGRGAPRACYVDRHQSPSITFTPVPDGASTYTARIVFQSYAPDLTTRQGNTKLGEFRTAWYLHLVTATAYEIANGPVRKLPKDEVMEMKQEALRLLADLEAYDDQEQAGPGRVAFYNGI